MRKNKIQVVSAAAALAAIMAIPGIAAADGHEEAKVRVGHFSPDAPAVDIYVNGEIFAGLEDVPFGVISDYVSVPADTYSVAVVVADMDPAEGTVIGPADIALESNTAATIFAIGSAADENLPALQPLVRVDASADMMEMDEEMSEEEMTEE